MKIVLIALALFIVSGCTSAQVSRVKGETKDGYTSYKTTVHLESVDQPICHGSCKE